MPFEYTWSGSQYESPVDPERCKASVPGKNRDHQCQHKRLKDGWCKQHHPDAIADRRAEQSQRWNEQAAERARRRLIPGLDEAVKRVKTACICKAGCQLCDWATAAIRGGGDETPRP